MQIVKSLSVALLLLTLAACSSTPAKRIESNPAAFAALSPEQQTRVKAGSVGVGFDEAAVRLALGEPDRVIERESGEGNSQVWVYYVAVPGSGASGFCGLGFPYNSASYRYGYGYGYGGAYNCGGGQQQYEERSRVVFNAGKVVSVERAK